MNGSRSPILYHVFVIYKIVLYVTYSDSKIFVPSFPKMKRLIKMTNTAKLIRGNLG